MALFAYGMNWYYLTLQWVRLRSQHMVRTPDATTFPVVTIQVPVYNERYVVRRLLGFLSDLDWPSDRLEIQVLDDSDDDTTQIIQDALPALRARGPMVHHLRRGTRDGFKAGALAHGLARSSGEFIAIFDCDFLPPRDILRRTVGEFDDPSVGLVQARWGHLNRDFSRLTRAQALGIDGHFAVEQEVRYRLGFLLNFNGTAGIWRASCIRDAGGWTGDTLAEDLDLSYRAQLRGWRCVYRKDVVCPAEIPAQLNAFKRQQFRWAKGSIQVFRKLRVAIVRSSLTFGQRVQAYLHLSLYVVHPLMLASFLLLPLVLLSGQLHPLVPAVFAAASLGPASMYVASQWEFSRPDWTRRILTLPFLTVLGVGQCFNNARAVLEAMAGWDSPFLRTPKFGIEGGRGNWRGSQYALGHGAGTLAEIALASYGGAGIVLAIISGTAWALPWLVLFTAGFTLVAGLTLWHSAGRGPSAREESQDAALG